MKPILLLITIFIIFIGLLFVVSADNAEPAYIGELPAIEIIE
jgi:hypothetical protein